MEKMEFEPEKIQGFEFDPPKSPDGDGKKKEMQMGSAVDGDDKFEILTPKELEKKKKDKEFIQKNENSENKK